MLPPPGDYRQTCVGSTVQKCVKNTHIFVFRKQEYCRATRRVGTRAGRRARVGARSDHWICWRRASLARQRDYWPRSCWTVDIVSGKPPALYSTCRQATHLGTIQHTGYISPSVATSADRHNTSTHDGLPATTLSQTQTPWDELWAQVHQSQTQHEQTPNFTQPPLYPLGCPDQQAL